MNQYRSEGRVSNRIKNTLFFTTFLLQLAWATYVFNAEGIEFINIFQKLISRSYSNFGLEWGGIGAYLVAATLLSSFFLNTTRRVSEGVLIGWPRFKEHDRHSTARAVTLLVGYGLITYFAIGVFGQKYLSKPIHFYDVLIISSSTYIIGLLVDFVDDVISGVFNTISYRGK